MENTKIVLSPSEVEWIGVRHLDVIGRVFKWRGTFYRAIYPHKVEWVEKLFDDGIITLLETMGFIPSTTVSQTVDVRSYGCVVDSENSPFATRLSTQPHSVIKEAALKWVRMNRVLLRWGLGLNDGHIDNFACFGTGVKWIDLGSIQNLRNTEMGIEEFLTSVVVPLCLIVKKPALRKLGYLALGNGGLSLEEGKELGVLDTNLDLSSRVKALNSLQALLEALDVNPSVGFWSDYTKEANLENILAMRTTPIDKDPRYYRFEEFLNRANPTRAIDLGSSAGSFAVLIARRGVPCLCVDMDEPALQMSLDFARENQLPICASLENVLGVKAGVDVDLVVAMALTHHLFFTHLSRFDVIAKIFARMTKNALITEYMPNGLGLDGPQPNPLPTDYTLEIFLSELKKHFHNVEAVEYKRPGSPRVMILCEGKIARIGDAI